MTRRSLFQRVGAGSLAAGALTSIGVEWQVTNFGTDEPNSPFWRDYVYLSLDTILDSSDARVGSVTNPQTLEPKVQLRQNKDWQEHNRSHVHGGHSFALRARKEGVLPVIAISHESHYNMRL